MTHPPPYPRTPYLADEPEALFGVACDAEEKLDGANVAIWLDGSRLAAMSRGGPDAMDRAGQLGRLRAWVADRDQPLRQICSDGVAVYGEWLWLRHTVPYDRLPDWLVVLDLLLPNGMWASTAERDGICRRANLVTPPVVARGVIVRSLRDAEALVPHAKWGSGPAEGVVLRCYDGTRRKVVREDFAPRSDQSWLDVSEHNQLA